VGKPVRPPEIQELRAFCTAADLGSLSRAARLLHVTQPALSKRLQSLEAVAGVRLLDRTAKGVTLTDDGRRLYSEARKLLAQADVVTDLLGGLESVESPVRIAVSHTIAEYVLPAKLVEYEARHEHHLSVELLISNSDVARRNVATGVADFGIAAEDPDGDAAGLHESPLLDDEVVVALHPAHPLAGHREIPLRTFIATPAVMRDPGANTRRVVDRILRELGHSTPPALAEVGSTGAAKQAALREKAPALLSSLSIADGQRDGLVVRRVEGVRFPRRFVVITAAERPPHAAARRFLDFLNEPDGDEQPT
jgi:DNA-binding transcriptional LysR family regulator